jgi:hypothetical protein
MLTRSSCYFILSERDGAVKYGQLLISAGLRTLSRTILVGDQGISKEQAREQAWITGTSPVVDRDLIGKISDEHLTAHLDAAHEAAVELYGSDAALRHALKVEVVGVEEWLFAYGEECYVVSVVHHPVVDVPAMIVMRADEALAREVAGAGPRTVRATPAVSAATTKYIHRGSMS